MKVNSKTVRLALLGMFAALLILMVFTPLGTITLGATAITIATIPVIVGAIVLGPSAGAILGAILGFLLFLTGIIGTDPLGVLMISANPFFTFVVCVVSRTLMGWLTGIIFQALNKFDKTKIVSYAVSSLSGAIINTALFLGLLWLCFSNTALLTYAEGAGMTVKALMTAIIVGNSIFEAIACLVLGTAVAKVIHVAIKRLQK